MKKQLAPLLSGLVMSASIASLGVVAPASAESSHPDVSNRQGSSQDVPNISQDDLFLEIAREYASQYGVSLEEAISILKNQNRENQLADEIEAKYPDAFVLAEISSGRKSTGGIYVHQERYDEIASKYKNSLIKSSPGMLATQKAAIMPELMKSVRESLGSKNYSLEVDQRAMKVKVQVPQGKERLAADISEVITGVLVRQGVRGHQVEVTVKKIAPSLSVNSAMVATTDLARRGMS